jgi:hypothetical protein
MPLKCATHLDGLQGKHLRGWERGLTYFSLSGSWVVQFVAFGWPSAVLKSRLSTHSVTKNEKLKNLCVEYKEPRGVGVPSPGFASKPGRGGHRTGELAQSKVKRE